MVSHQVYNLSRRYETTCGEAVLLRIGAKLGGKDYVCKPEHFHSRTLGNGSNTSWLLHPIVGSMWIYDCI